MKKRRLIKYFYNRKIIRFGLSIFLLFFFFCACLSAQNDSQQQELKSKIENLRSQIQQYQNQIYSKEKQAETLAGDVTDLEKDIAKIELQIEETELVIQSLNIDIANKQLEIDAMQKEVVAKKTVLSQFMQELYERGDATSIELALGNENFSDYFFQADSIESFEERAREIYDQFVFLREGLKREQEAMLSRKQQQTDLRIMQKDQEKTLDQEKTMKNILLTKTRNEKEAISLQMEKLQEELSALQSLGEPINIDTAISAARYASRFTNVAPEFLLGVLRIESSLGTNVGGGRYKTDMNPAQWDTFKKICDELGTNPSNVPVSRRACYNSDAKDGCGGWGGAMGPAQFMPSTWMGYKSKVEKLTGQAPANPWSLEDSLVAMGLKLAAVDGVTSGDQKAWAKAAGMYLAGGNWENYSWYSDRVLFYADGFKKVINSKI
jgi:peptidoglycan hydrolase CwlO-like protein